MENYQNLIQQAEIAYQNLDLLTAEHLYFQAANNALQNLNLSEIFVCIQKILEMFPQNVKSERVENYINAFLAHLTESEETEHFQKLQTALQNQKNQNVNLQIVLAKILIYQAFSAENFADEYQKLCKAKNLINNVRGEYARYQKALIELYLAKNSQKVLPPPPLINYKIYNQSSIINNFSTRNSKNFLEKSQKLWQKNQIEIAKKIPNLKFFADEIKEFENIKITAFFTNGRAGSHFVHSLLDGYPNIATIPSFCLRFIFDPKFLNTLFPANMFDDLNWKENLLQRFFNAFSVIFNGEETEFGNFIGFRNMGKNGDQILRVNKKAFTEFLLNELKKRKKISIAAFAILVHFAYEYALGRFGRLKQNEKFKQQKNIIFYNIHFDIHFFDIETVKNFCVAFPNAKYLTITREPVNMLEASAKLYMQALDPLTARSALGNLKPYDVLAHGGKDLLITWQNVVQLFSYPKFLPELFLRFGFEKSVTIRLEDIKNHPKTALLNLLSWLGVENPKWDACLEQETFAGFLYAGATQNRVKGFDASHLKKQGAFFSQNDLRIMNLLLYPVAVKFGYRQKNDDFLDSEIFWYENQQKIETYMDFEQKIIDRLKQDFPNFENSQMMAPYFYRLKWSKRNLNYIKKYRENCVGFADLLPL